MERKFVDRRAGIAQRASIYSALVLIPSLAGFCGNVWWGLDLLAHFRMQYACVSLIGAALALLRPSRMAAIPVLTLLVNLACIVPLELDREDPLGDVPPLVVTSFNVHTRNVRKAEVIAFLERSGADVIYLIEVDQSWVDAAAKIAPPYRMVEARPSNDNFGMVAIARVEVSATRVLTMSSSLVDTIELTVPWHGGEIVLLGTHTLPPLNARYARARNEQLMQIAKWSLEEKRPHAVLGDFNATPWSAPFRNLLERGALRGPTPGSTPSWPYQIPFGPLLRIPIDHALVGSGLLKREQRFGDNLGSDHRPLTVSLTPRY